MKDDLISRSALLDFCDAKAFAALYLHDGGMIRKIWIEALEAVEKQPTIDAVQVIRCADCDYYGKSPFGHPHIGWCRIDCKHRKPQFYCANADRK